MRRQSPLVSGIIYIILGIIFTALAINYVSKDGWNLFSFLIVFLATIDIGSGIRLITLHLRLKRMQKKK
ncbi:YdiK family protein [Bacillus massiliigorillae]|uniref:YdiK family protein n=1 Tax=Bacillus massiliigorillae TaxID=1243664 RepID=UPI0003A96873|nr:YdiK family protein [Bacillus massiliigorillae]